MHIISAFLIQLGLLLAVSETSWFGTLSAVFQNSDLYLPAIQVGFDWVHL